MNNIRKVSTVGMSREEWLLRRRKSIGGSDAAGIIGLSKWASPYSVWADKTGRLPDKPDSEAMRLGRDLEDYVARRWMEETGKKVKRVNAMLYNPLYPFAHADIDRCVMGEEAGLECKTTSALDVRQFDGVDFPAQYYAQCVHYMAVTGAKRWYLAVLVLGRGFFHFALERNQAEIDALMGMERDFWRLVEQDTPPAVDGAQATAETLQTIFPESREEEIDLFGRERLLKEYLELKEQEKSLELRRREIEAVLMQDMGEAQRGRCGGYSVLWKSQRRKTFQVKDFQKDFPDMDLEPYFKIGLSRPFKVMGEKDI